MSDVIVDAREKVFVVMAAGTDLLAPLAARAQNASAEAIEAAAASAVSAATAESAAGPTYPSTAAGLAATVEGQSFAVDNGDGTVTIYLNDGGVASEQRTLATTEALAGPDGAKRVGNADGGTVQDALPISVASFATPQAAATAAEAAKADVFVPAGDFIGDVDDTSDAIFEGDGRVFNTSGVQTSTYAEPRSRFVIGQEYLWAFHSGVINNPVGTKLDAAMSGDSTSRGAFGPGNLPVEYQVYQLLDAQLNRYGIFGPVFHNRATSGMTTREWIGPPTPGAITLDEDIAAFPNLTLYILRWGLNDGAPGTGYHDIEQYRRDLREALTRIRAWKGVDQLSIILMTPNTTSETAFRDEAWHERVSRVVKRAARDFQCCFIDTYAIWRDARSGLGKWLDTEGMGGSGIHPDRVFNHWIADEIGRVAFSPLAVRTSATNTFVNVSGNAFRLITASAPPESFNRGPSWFRTDNPNTFPLDGMIQIARQADGILKQENTGFTNETTQRTYTRYATDGGTWSLWRGLDYELELASGWTVFDAGTPPVAVNKSVEGQVHLHGRVKNAAAASGDTMFTLLPGFLPLVTKHFLVCNQTNDTVGRISIGPTGAVKWISGTNTDVVIDITFKSFG